MDDVEHVAPLDRLADRLTVDVAVDLERRDERLDVLAVHVDDEVDVSASFGARRRR
ncbi:MAG: hypothetical protein M5U28_01935 [Sandaracinaceae bacterium]|nr:hypothetical protein [Sandaracinaceae bacterium]